jgi:hypothetical protein
VTPHCMRRTCFSLTSIAAIVAVLWGAGLLSEQNLAYADTGAPADVVVSTRAAGAPGSPPPQLSGSSTVVIRGTRPPAPKPAEQPPAPAQAEANPLFRNPAFERDPYGSGLNTDFNSNGLSFNPPW